MKGNLSDQPLVELVREIDAKGLSGTLRLQADRAQCAVYFEEGKLIFAASNLRTLRLRSYLEKQSSINPEDLERIGNVSDMRLLAALRMNGVLADEQIVALLTTAVTDVLRVGLLWAEGTWEFDERARFAESWRINLNIQNLLREAAQRLPQKLVTSRFRNPNEKFARNPRVEKGSTVLPGESFLLSRLDQPMKLEDLIAVSGLHDLDAHRVIYGLCLTDTVTREFWQHAFRTILAKPVQTDEWAKVASQFEKADDESAVEQFLQRINDALDHYEILELPERAEAGEVKNAYYRLARRYHPDRFHLQSGTSLHTRLGSAFARVTQAYETLIDPKARTTYDATLERTRQFRRSEVSSRGDYGADFDENVAPDENFQRGCTALQQEQFNAAINYLAAAARAVPGEARYRAYYGKALAATENTRRLAENELQAAVKMEPRNSMFHTFLAELYVELNFHKRAEAALERALSLDPNNGLASSLLRKIQKSRKLG